MEASAKIILLSLLICLSSTSILTYAIMRLSLRKGFMDIPNARSSHTSPTPRGGGIAIAVTFLVFLFFYQGIAEVPFDVSTWIGLLVGGVLVATLGALDDLKPLPVRWRFLVQLIAVFLSLSLLPLLPEIKILGHDLVLGAFAIVLFAISLVWFINLFNFMDGIDGLAGVEAVTTVAGAALIMLLQNQVAWVVVFGSLAACVAGFLVWNWPPAKVFMGDSGSGFLGFTLGMLAIVTAANGALNAWSWIILFGVFIIDASTTLLRRLARGDRWYLAHRSHAYQILSRRHGSHLKVSLGVAVINIAWLWPMSYLAARNPYWASIICGVALSPLVFVAIRAGAGKPDTET